jgi:hypothetical protein
MSNIFSFVWQIGRLFSLFSESWYFVDYSSGMSHTLRACIQLHIMDKYSLTESRFQTPVKERNLLHEWYVE